MEVDGAEPKVAERHKYSTYTELARGGLQKLLVHLVLGSEIEGRWNVTAQRFVCNLVRLRALRAPPAERNAVSSVRVLDLAADDGPSCLSLRPEAGTAPRCCRCSVAETISCRRKSPVNKKKRSHCGPSPGCCGAMDPLGDDAL